MAEAISAGRYRDLSEVIAAGMSLLQRNERARAELQASVLGTEEEADTEGWLTADEVVERALATISRRPGAAS